MPIVLQPIDQTAKLELAQQLACWAKLPTGMTDPAVQYGTCCVSPTGQTLGRWTIPDDLCDTYGPLPFTGNNGQEIECPIEGDAAFMPYYIFDEDVSPIDPNTCITPDPLATPTGLAAGTETATTIPLTWDAVAGATGYTVRYSATGDAPWTEVASATAAVTLVDLEPDTEYTIQVRADDSTGTNAPSDWSASITAETAE